MVLVTFIGNTQASSNPLEYDRNILLDLLARISDPSKKPMIEDILTRQAEFTCIAKALHRARQNIKDEVAQLEKQMGHPISCEQAGYLGELNGLNRQEILLVAQIQEFYRAKIREMRQLLARK